MTFSDVCLSRSSLLSSSSQAGKALNIQSYEFASIWEKQKHLRGWRMPIYSSSISTARKSSCEAQPWVRLKDILKVLGDKWVRHWWDVVLLESFHFDRNSVVSSVSQHNNTDSILIRSPWVIIQSQLKINFLDTQKSCWLFVAKAITSLFEINLHEFDFGKDI
jgi:hypothetical protein